MSYDNAWQDEMRRREHDPIRSDYSSKGRGGSPVPSLQRMLTALYEAEVDFHLCGAWDCGFRLSVHKPREVEPSLRNRGERLGQSGGRCAV
jgi:hypothetical protein